MALREIARFVDVYEADLAAAFLESHGIRVTVTERFQTTVDPLMQRALGIRLMAHDSEIEAARDLLARVKAGEFAESDEFEPTAERDMPSGIGGRVIAVMTAASGGFSGTSIPRRLKPVHWIGLLLILSMFGVPYIVFSLRAL